MKDQGQTRHQAPIFGETLFDDVGVVTAKAVLQVCEPLVKKLLRGWLEPKIGGRAGVIRFSPKRREVGVGELGNCVDCSVARGVLAVYMTPLRD
jgi:hypothetical protein